MALRFKHPLLFALITGLAFMCGTFLVTPKAQAVSASAWQAGRIIDDSVFTSKNDMSVNDIQAFLNAKVPQCDTSGSQNTSQWYAAAGRYYTRAEWGAMQGNPQPFTCLKDYYEVPKSSPGAGTPANNYGGRPIPSGAISAAQMIWNAAQENNISPRVLLTTIQKESAGPLTVDTWPYLSQYTYAMGAHCPDGPNGAQCDPNYAGFSIQIYESARLFRYYLNNMYQPWWPYKKPGVNFVLWNVQSTGCGGANVHIQTMATAALYTYTPYQPNTAALNNMYGTGDGCSAYGNRNFWRIFNDWFGPTTGPLIRTTSSPDLYYSDGTTKYRVGSMYVAIEYGLGLGDVRFVSQSEMDSLANPTSPSPSNLTQVVKSTSDSDEDGGALYIVAGGNKYMFTSMTQFADFGYTVDQITYLPLGQLQRLGSAGNLSNYVRRSDGYIYQVSGYVRRGILNGAYLSQLNPGGNITSLSDFILNPIPVGPLLVNSPISLQGPDGRLWLVTPSGWYYITSMSLYECLGMGTFGLVRLDYSQTSLGTQLTTPGCLVQTSGGQQYIMDNWRRIPVNPAWGFSSFSTLDDSFINRFPAYSPTSSPAFRTQSNGSLYVFEGGKKRQVLNMTSFSANGLVPNDIFTAASEFLTTIPNGTYKLGDGMVVRNSSTGQLYVINGSNKLYITSMEAFRAYGFTGAGIIDMNTATLDAYPTSGNLQQMARIGTKATFFDSAIGLQIPSGIEAHWGVSGSTPTYPSGLVRNIAFNVQATRYIKFTSSGMLYYLENGTKRPVYSWTTFTSLGGNANNIMVLSDESAAVFPTGSPM